MSVETSQLKSPCCDTPLRVIGSGTQYYVCSKCLMPCDPVSDSPQSTAWLLEQLDARRIRILELERSLGAMHERAGNAETACQELRKALDQMNEAARGIVTKHFGRTWPAHAQ